MWFEQLAEGAEKNNSPEAINGLYGIMFYYFIATCFVGLIWVLWQIMELGTAITHNLILLAGVFGLMALVEEGLRRLKSWAKLLLTVNYVVIIGAALIGLVLAVKAIMTEATSGAVTAITIYLLILLMYGYGLIFSSSPAVKKINWR
jgi:hypothetical protein